MRFLSRSIGQRRGRVAVAAASIMIASAVVVCALGISLGIRQKLGGELRAYGANLMIVPMEGQLDSSALGVLGAEPGIEGYTAQLYASVSVSGATVEMIGMDTGKVETEDGWKVEGEWPASGQVLVGKSLAEALKLKAGSDVRVEYSGHATGYRVSGLIERGGPEDSAVLMSIEQAQALTGMENKVSAILARAKSETLQATAAALRAKLKGAEVKTLRQVAGAEESFLAKIELLMGLVTIVIVMATSISVSSTMSATMLERLKEIGLMRAIGGTKAEIRVFFIAEAAAIGLMGGLSGFIMGVISAEAVSKAAFNAYVGVPVFLLPLSVALGLGIAVLASMLPLADALRQRPSVILRGE